MILQVCADCAHGGVKDGRSHCGREAVYSHLNNCIQKVALEDYIERNSVSGDVLEMVGNQ